MSTFSKATQPFTMSRLDIHPSDGHYYINQPSILLEIRIILVERSASLTAARRPISSKIFNGESWLRKNQYCTVD